MKHEFKNLSAVFPDWELNKKVDAINYFILEQIEAGIKRWSDLNGEARERGLIVLADELNTRLKRLSKEHLDVLRQKAELIERLKQFQSWVDSEICCSGVHNPLCTDLTNELLFAYGVEKPKES